MADKKFREDRFTAKDGDLTLIPPRKKRSDAGKKRNTGNKSGTKKK